MISYMHFTQPVDFNFNWRRSDERRKLENNRHIRFVRRITRPDHQRQFVSFQPQQAHIESVGATSPCLLLHVDHGHTPVHIGNVDREENLVQLEHLDPAEAIRLTVQSIFVED